MSEWKKVKIGDFLTESKIIAIESNAAHRITVRLNCKGVEQRSLKAEKEGATKYYTRKSGQFIYGKQNIHKGAFGIIPQELDGFTSSADLPAFDVDLSKCIPEWICICLQKDEYYKTLQKNVKGVGSQRLAVNVFLDSEIPLPPVEKQVEIIKKIKLQLQKTEQLSVEIESQKNYIKQLRQNILQEAIEGKLTAEWRKQNPVQKGNPNYDAEALFEQIQKERNNEKKQKELSQIIDEEKPFEIPEGWKWVRLGEIIKEPPRNGYSPKAVDFETPIKTLKLGAVTYGIFDPNEYKYINEEIPKDAYCWLKNGDFLIERSNSVEYVGICAIYTGKDNEFMYPDLLMRFRTQDVLLKQYIHTALISPFNRSYFMSKAKGAQKTMPKINQECVVNTMIPLPPLKEQEEIVNKVETLLAKVATLGNQIQERKTLSEKLAFGIIKEKLEG